MDRRVDVKSRLAAVLTTTIWGCKIVTWTALILAICGTSYVVYEEIYDSHGTIYFALDTSSSMRYGITDEPEVKLAGDYDKKWKGYKWEQPKATNTYMGGWGGYGGGSISPGTVPTRIEAALGMIHDLADEDRYLSMGLLAADDHVFYVYPATKKHELIVDLLPNVKKYLDENSTGDNFCGPTDYSSNIGLGPVTVQLFDHEPADGPHILAFYSDGDFDCNQDRMDWLKKEFERLHIHMVVMGVGGDWATDSGEVPQFKNFLKMVGGEVIQLQDPEDFKKGWAHLKQLANEGVHKEKVEHRKDALLLLLAIAFGAALTGLFLSWIRRSSSL
jgi:hypothetical protein